MIPFKAINIDKAHLYEEIPGTLVSMVKSAAYLHVFAHSSNECCRLASVLITYLPR